MASHWLPERHMEFFNTPTRRRPIIGVTLRLEEEKKSKRQKVIDDVLKRPSKVKLAV